MGTIEAILVLVLGAALGWAVTRFLANRNKD